MYNKTSRSVGLIQPLDHRGLNLNKHRLLTTDSYYNNSNCQSNTTREINCFSKMALKWLNRLSSLLQHLFDLTAIKNRNDDDGVEGFDAVFHFLQYDSSEFTHI